jgi:hypothetical protein
MANITLDIPHDLDLPRAKQAAQLALDHYLSRYGTRGLQASWASDTRVKVELDVRGAHLQGFIDILPTKLQITAGVPLLLHPFKSVAVAAIERETKRWVEEVKLGNVSSAS